MKTEKKKKRFLICEQHCEADSQCDIRIPKEKKRHQGNTYCILSDIIG